MTLEDLNFVVRQIEKFIEDEGLREELKSSELRLNEVKKGTYTQSQLKKVLAYNNILIKKIQLFETILWSDQEVSLLDKLGFENLFGSQSKEFLSSRYSIHYIDGAKLIRDIETINEELRKGIKMLEISTNLFDQLGLIEEEVTPQDDDFGIVEIIFDNNVSIDNFDDARSQMKSWYLIIEGYSRLLNIPREEFVIVGFSKNSPTKIKVQVKIDVAEIIAAVGNFVLGAYGMYLTTVKSIDALESSVFISNEVKVQMVDVARKDLDAGIKTHIQEIVDKEIDNRLKDRKDKEEVRVALTKGLTQQFNFTQHGGSINLYVGGNEQSDEIKQFEKTKQEIQLLERGVSKQKLIEDTMSEDDENDDDENEKHGDYLNLED